MGTDIITDILSRLPVKSLVRFKCVSKSCYKLISEPYFKRKHLNHANSQKKFQKFLFGLCVPYNFRFYSCSLWSRRMIKDVQRLDYPPNYVPRVRSIYCCYDGLFLIGIRCRRRFKGQTFLLWNPSTRESKQLPLPNSSYDSIYGLGYDSTSDDYIVLKVEDDQKFEDGEVPEEILSLKSGSWRTLRGRNYRNFSSKNNRDSLAFVHGAFHWLCFTEINRFGFAVISFNISNEIYEEVPLPEQKLRPYSMERHLAVLGGMLSLTFVYHCERSYFFFDLWVMKEYGVKESWTKLFTMDMGRTNISPIIPKYLFGDGEVLLTHGINPVFMTSKGSTGSINPIGSLVSDDFDEDTFRTAVFVYTESLISPYASH